MADQPLPCRLPVPILPVELLPGVLWWEGGVPPGGEGRGDRAGAKHNPDRPQGSCWALRATIGRWGKLTQSGCQHNHRSPSGKEMEISANSPAKQASKQATSHSLKTAPFRCGPPEVEGQSMILSPHEDTPDSLKLSWSYLFIPALYIH